MLTNPVVLFFGGFVLFVALLALMFTLAEEEEQEHRAPPRHGRAFSWLARPARRPPAHYYAWSSSPSDDEPERTAHEDACDAGSTDGAADGACEAGNDQDT